MKPSIERPLTERQKEVVYGIAEGLTFEQIAERMGISRSAVKQHADVVRQKLGVAKRSMIPQSYYVQTGENPYPE